ncbi:hypothetical protein TNCV_341471 [Trichonephila clavipes]|nr:hypothetical protein TNCV_341471 [Trichonephila clavipes]
MMSHSCPIGERSGDLLDQHNTLTTYRACWVTIGCQKDYLQALTWPSNQYTAITAVAIRTSLNTRIAGVCQDSRAPKPD